MDFRRAGSARRLFGSGPPARVASLFCQLFRAPPGTPRFLRVRRFLTGVAFLPSFLLLQCINRLCLRLDDWLFPAYRQVRVERPLFIIGAPRTGTTATHRWLARDPRFTTLATWECLFAPSVIQRRIVAALGRIDQGLGSPARRSLAWLETRLLGSLDDIHPVSLGAPEEDYLTLLPRLECFALVIAFPDSSWLWRTARCDEALSSEERRSLMRHYRGYLQRHLYHHGTERVLLSKNASFAGMVHTLAAAFPDARFLLCDREATALARSQFAALEPGRKLFGLPPSDPVFRDRLLATLAFYLANLRAFRRHLPATRCQTVSMEALAQDPEEILARSYRALLGEPLPVELAEALSARQGRRHRPRQPPALDSLGLSITQLRQRLMPGGCAP